MITGDEDQRPEVRSCSTCSSEEPAAARRWVRAGRRARCNCCLQQDFAGFEDALADYRERGFIIRSARNDQSGSGRFSPGQNPVR